MRAAKSLRWSDFSSERPERYARRAERLQQTLKLAESAETERPGVSPPRQGEDVAGAHARNPPICDPTLPLRQAGALPFFASRGRVCARYSAGSDARNIGQTPK